jgi:hypothetical protein
MATVLEECTIEEQRSVVRFLWAMQGIFIKKCFLFRVGSVFGVKRFTNGSGNSLKDVRKSQMMPDQVRKWLRQLSKDFRRTGKAMGQVYQSWWRICREINIYSRFEYHMSHVLYPSVTYLLTLSRSSSTASITKLHVMYSPLFSCYFLSLMYKFYSGYEAQ